ncbi:MAG: MFS transporter [Candidatus Omnitrophica bacterium]|nr:MFS transporter [Candidatus Omnitrophota bacterium]
MSFRISLYFFFIFGSLGVFFFYFQIFLKDCGFSFAQIGAIQATFPLIAMIAAPTWGMLADSSSDPRWVLRTLLFFGPLSFVLLWFGRDFSVCLLLAAFLGIFFQPIIPIHDSLVLRSVHLHGGDYGAMRIWGSIGFTIPAFIIAMYWSKADGEAIDWTIPTVIFLGYSILAVLASFWFPKVPPEKKHGFSFEGFELLKNRSFVVLLATVFLGRWAFSSLEGYQAIHFGNLGVPLERIALYSSLGPVSEVFTVFFAQRWMAKYGAYRLMAAALIAMVIRLWVTAEATHHSTLILIQLLHSLTFGLLYVTTILTVNQLASDRIRSSAQTIAVIFCNYAARISGLVSSGFLADRLGLPGLFRMAAWIAGAGLVCWLLFFKETKATHLEGGVK